MNDASIQELFEARDAELHKVLKQKLVLNYLRSLNPDKEKSPEIQRALRLLSVGEFMRLGDEQQYLLGLQDCINNPPQISYIDRKALHTKMAADLRENLTPIAELGDKIRNEMPDALTNDRGDVQLTTEQQEIIRLQKERRESLEKLVRMRREKCTLMMTAADLKLGPHLVQELKMKQSEAEVLLTKADLLRCYITNNIFSQADHSLKAYKEVDKYLDELLLNVDKTKAKGAAR